MGPGWELFNRDAGEEAKGSSFRRFEDVGVDGMFLRFGASPRKRFCGNDAVAMMPVVCGSAGIGVVNKISLCTRGREASVNCVRDVDRNDGNGLSLNMRVVSRLDSVGQLGLVLSNV